MLYFENPGSFVGVGYQSFLDKILLSSYFFEIGVYEYGANG
jgi:hypothetical protein